MPDVVTLGDITVDVIARIPHYPALGDDSLAERVEIRAGGSAANTAVVLSKFGLSASIIARVGEDLLAGYALADLQRANVSVSHTQRDAESMTGLVFAAVTPDGERTFFSCRGANPLTVLESDDEADIQKAKHLHVSGYALVKSPQRDAAFKAIELSYRSGVVVSVDLGVEVMTIAKEHIVSMLPMVSMLFPNRGVAEWLTGGDRADDCVTTLLRLGPQLVGLKLSDQGCMMGSADGIHRVPAFDVQAVDDTGAGDSFDAGLILGRLAGLSVRESALLANALGALATTVTGAGSSLPGPQAALSLLEKRRVRVEWQDWSQELAAVCNSIANRIGDLGS
jgi:ribokinase